MKRAWVKYLLLGLATYVIALLITLPAHYVYGVAAPRLPQNVPLTLQALDGSVWSGRAGAVIWRGTPLGVLQWELSPWQLLAARVGLRWQLQDAGTTLTGRASIARDGSATLREVNAHLPAARFMLFNPGLPIAVDGTVVLNLEEAHLPAGAAPALRGTVLWSQALLVAGQPMPLGDLRLTLQPGEGGGTSGTLADAGGPLEISGTLALDANRTYRLEARLRARPEADAALRNSLPMLGRADGRGYHTLRYSGRL